ncbi:hypothetical protein [Lysinibacillus sp. BPa_S21]|uniref:hypothetical protein n=1 Tax=Lysinibacillus sp. BPa_S21 TaxID=2932478 RepID=UPI00201305B1|nr:hypothetical protein [Lysinibacillus sp. BPa_S21]MCL1695541.1 hypothetical protein [Lysinibacillus sp. BPa_S21]
MPLTLRFRAEQSFLGASGQHDVGHEGVITGRDVLSLRSPLASLAMLAPGSRANRCLLRESEAAAAPMLVTKALSQDVMVLAFVPLSLIPKESPASTPINNSHDMRFYKMTFNFLVFIETLSGVIAQLSRFIYQLSRFIT